MTVDCNKAATSYKTAEQAIAFTRYRLRYDSIWTHDLEAFLQSVEMS